MSERSLLPGNATVLETSLSLSANARMGNVDVEAVRREREPQTCDAVFLPLLGFERSLHHWVGGDAPGNAKKIAASFADHLSYGSPSALEAEIAADTGQTIRLREFYEYASVWPGFKIDTIINPGDASPNLAAANASAVARKNVRDLYEGARIFARQPPSPAIVGAATHMSSFLTIYPVGGNRPPPTLFTGAASRALGVNKILPLRIT